LKALAISVVPAQLCKWRKETSLPTAFCSNDGVHAVVFFLTDVCIPPAPDDVSLIRITTFFVTTKVARLETTKTGSYKGTKKEKVLKCLVFLVSLCLCGD
jgi:hypothetical protein